MALLNKADANRTVGDLFLAEKLGKDELWRATDVSDYWNNAACFILDNWDERAIDLSQKQFTWMHKILEDLTEKRIEGKL